MKFGDFEKKIKKILKQEEETGLFKDELKMYLAADGCLSCEFNGELIPCEGLAWEDSLDKIITYIASKEEP